MGRAARHNTIVYVIDDNTDVRDALTDLLGSMGLHRRAFASATEYLRSKRFARVSCLISDVHLPGLGGLDLQNELARMKHNIPIILITGDNDQEMRVKAIKAGAIKFLTKPFGEQDLVDAVYAALDRDRERHVEMARTAKIRSPSNMFTTRNRSPQLVD